MSKNDCIRWDNRYSGQSVAAISDEFPLSLFAAFADQFPVKGYALELACGRGEVTVWFAQQGLSVYGVDVSPVAIDLAKQLASEQGVSGCARFDVFDLDNGLPETPAVDLLVCQNFRDPGLYRAIQDRLASNGLLAIVTLSDVGAEAGRFRAKPGELQAAFSDLNILCVGEADGRAWLLAKKPVRVNSVS